MKSTFFASVFVSALVLQGLFALPAFAQELAPQYPYYPSPPPTSYCPSLTYNLYYGLSDYHTGGQVSRLQLFLGYHFVADPVPVTGYFGPITQGYVARFQREQGVYPITGGVGPLTRAAIERLCGGGVGGGLTFYLNTPFMLSPGQVAREQGGGLAVTLEQIDTSWWSWWGQSARVRLSYSCPSGRYCTAVYYPEQVVVLSGGQSATFAGYTVTLNSVQGASVIFTVTSGLGIGQSGVMGQVLRAPTCPVQYPGVSCTEPYQTTVNIREEYGSLIMSVPTDAEGHFSAALAPGTYVLEARGGQIFPFCRAQTIVVRQGEYVSATITCDTGIR